MTTNSSAILITVDVEDWFQVENFKPWIPFSSWDSQELRVESNTRRLLDLFDTVPGPVKPRATFFVLGWVAERLPGLVRDIHRRGHEVASHGSLHELCYDLSSADLQNDLLKSRELLEDLLGHPVKGYRAPSFSINHEVLRAIRKSGYRYDSSYNSFGLHGRYGHIDLSANSGLCRGNECENNGIAVPMLDDLMELPISNLTWAGRTLPWGGGGYFRLMPFFLMAWGMRRILNRDRAYVFYMHPWEIDPNQPRVWQASPSYRFRHYVNLDHTLAKLERLLNSFSDSRFITCDQYLAQTKGGAFNPRADASHTSSEVQS